MRAISDLAKDALELPSRQRLVLARILLELSDESQDFSSEAEDAWEAEIFDRIKAVEAGTAETRPMKAVFADLDRRFPS